MKPNDDAHLGPWGRWAFALLLVTAAGVVLSFAFPWWELRTYDATGAGGVILEDGQWCWIDRGQTTCWPYVGSGPYTPHAPAGLASAMLWLEVLQIAVAVAFVVAFVVYAVPRMRARAPRALALAELLGTAGAWVAVAYAWLSLPGTEGYGPLDPNMGFTGASGGWGTFINSGRAWGAGVAWFLLLVTAGTGVLALLALRAAGREAHRSRAALSGVKSTA